jgi:archaellum biogenesis ATPase FlaH
MNSDDQKTIPEEADTVSRVESGFTSLDFLLRGGIPEDPDVVICGTATDVAMIARNILWHRLQAGDACVYGTLSQTCDEFLTDMQTQDRDVTRFLEDGQLAVLDYLSLSDDIATTPLEKMRVLLSLWTKTINPQTLFKPLAREFWRVQNQHPTKRFLAILDSIDHVIKLVGLQATLAFRQLIDDLLHETHSLGIGLLCTDTLSTEELEAVRNASSLFIELHRDINGLPKIRVTKDLHMPWSSLF